MDTDKCDEETAIVETVSDEVSDDDIDEELYPAIGDATESDNGGVTVIESLCMNCHNNGQTRLLLTRIPFFREVILMSFECPHCGFRSNEVQPGGAVQNRGNVWTLRADSKEDFDRQVIKSNSATFVLRELEFEIPAGRGVMTTVEGLLSSALEQLRETQAERERVAPDVAAKLAEFISSLALCLAGLSFPVTFELNDPAGNSFIENPNAPHADPKLVERHYVRSAAQHVALGLQPERYESHGEDEGASPGEKEGALLTDPTRVADGSAADAGTAEAAAAATPAAAALPPSAPVTSTSEVRMAEKEVFSIEVDCPNCGAEGHSRMCVTDIPFFKEVVIMAFNCEHCGFRSNEVKGGGAVPPRGQRTTLRIASADGGAEAEATFAKDMARDLIKSNTSAVLIPELELEVTRGSLGGMYTTVEGLLQQMRDKLFEGQAGSLAQGDSASDERRAKMEDFGLRFDALIAGRCAFTLVASVSTIITTHSIAMSYLLRRHTLLVPCRNGCADAPLDRSTIAQTLVALTGRAEAGGGPSGELVHILAFLARSRPKASATHPTL